MSVRRLVVLLLIAAVASLVAISAPRATRRESISTVTADVLPGTTQQIQAPGGADNQKLTSKMLYHNGPVLTGTRNIYMIWYGCWADNCGFGGNLKTMNIMADFLISIGNTPYARINSTYTDASGQPAASAFIYGGDFIDSSYAHGVDLTPADITAIISDRVNNFELPQDRNGIYVIVASPDIASSATGFCTPSAPPFHAQGIVNGDIVRYIFLGHPNRCPSVAGPQFSPSGPTPNDSYAADVLVSNLAHAINGLVTNPVGNGWYDRYGLENADKCQDALGHPAFGQTYLTANGAKANVRFGGQDYLVQQNWVNDRKARCAMSQ
jgi:phosphate-induced protein 1